MKRYGPWGLFCHESDLDLLEASLLLFWGIKPLHMKQGSSVEDIYTITEYLCQHIGGRAENDGVSDKNYFLDAIATPQSEINKLDYLVLDSLFLLRQEELTPSKYRSSSAFLDTLFKGHDTKTISKNFKDFYDTENSYFPKNFGIKKTGSEKRGNYSIPVFLDSLLLWTIESSTSNPYLGEKTPSQKTISSFFLKNYSELIRYFSSNSDLSEARQIIDKSHADAALDRLLTYYALDRLFDADSMIRIILGRDDLPARIDDVADIVLPLYFIPNTLEKWKYLDLMFQSIQGEKILSTQFDWWNEGAGSIGTLTAQATKIETAAINLTKIGEYFRYLSMVYYPVLTATFYTLFRRCYPILEDGKRLLLSYADNHKLLSVYETRMLEQVNIFAEFHPRDWRQTIKYYSYIKEGVWMDEATTRKWKNQTTIRYVEDDGTYLDTLTQAVIRKKVEFQRVADPVLLSEKQSRDMMTGLKALLSNKK